MAFPVVALKGTTYTTGGTATDTHVVDLPDSLAVGQRLIVVASMRNSSAITWPAGWTEIVAVSAPTSGGRLEARYHDVDGGEGASITLTTVSCKGVAFSWKITGHDSGTAPEGASSTASTSTTPDPPSLNPAGWGTEDTLWIAANHRNQNQTTTTYPTNYADNQEDAVSTGSSACSASICTRGLNAASEDPGTFTITGTGANVAAITIAVRPSVGDVINVPLLTVTPSLPSPSVGLNVAVPLLTVTPNLPMPLVGAAQIVAPTLLTITPSLPSPAVGLRIAPPLLSVAPTLPDPGVTGGFADAVFLSPWVEPFYEGAAVTSSVPDEFPVALAGHPYVIEPALYRRTFVPLRRDPRDDSREPGEQTLSPAGLWRRSQSDWSLGAGQEWLDEEESVRRRFSSSIGMDVLQDRQACLLPATEEKRSSANTNLQLLTVGSRLYVMDGTAVVFGTDPTAATWSGFTSATGLTGTLLDITSTGAHVYVVAGDNSIYRATPGTASFAGPWYNPTAVVTKLWFAIGRLFATDGDKLYEITATPGETLIFDHPLADASITALDGGPTGVYVAVNIGQNSEVRHFAVDPDGTTFTAPVVVAQFLNEQIHDIKVASKAVVIGTSLGFRFAVAADSGAGLEFGPVVTTPGEVRCLTVDAIGAETFFWFGWSNIETGVSGLGRIRPSRFTETLVPAFASDIYSTAGGTPLTVASFGGRRYFGISADGFFGPDTNLTLVPEGNLTTGRIRYGILDNKVYTDLSWRTDPLAGSIEALATYDTGAERSVGSQTSAGSVEPGSLTLGATPAEWLEITFTLTRSATDPTDGPCLRWWLTKAIPAAQTTERILLPVKLHQKVVTPAGRQVAQDPFVELEFLRGLVLSQEIVSYQEGNSSESVYVSNLEVQPTQWNDRDKTFESTTLVELFTT